MQNTDVFDEFSQEEKSEKQFRDEGLVNFPQTVPPVELLPDKAEEIITYLGLEEVTPIALSEPHCDGPIALMERGRELMLAAHRGITPPVRSWKVEAEQWWADCNDWAEANPTADN